MSSLVRMDGPLLAKLAWEMIVLNRRLVDVSQIHPVRDKD
jgi:hypothetical protein